MSNDGLGLAFFIAVGWSRTRSASNPPGKLVLRREARTHRNTLVPWRQLQPRSHPLSKMTAPKIASSVTLSRPFCQIFLRVLLDHRILAWLDG